MGMIYIIMYICIQAWASALLVSDYKGDARASMSGMSSRTDSHAFFVYTCLQIIVHGLHGELEGISKGVIHQ